MKPRPKNDLFVLCRNGCCRGGYCRGGYQPLADHRTVLTALRHRNRSVPTAKRMLCAGGQSRLRSRWRGTSLTDAACPLRAPPLRTRSVSTGLGLTKCRPCLQLLNVTPVRGEKGSCRRMFLPGKGLAGVKNRAAGGPPDERYYLRMPSFAMMAR